MLTGWCIRNSSITFDVGTAGVRAHQVTGKRTGLSGRETMHLPLLPSDRDVNTELTKPDYSRITRLVGQGGFEGRDTSLVLSPPDVRFCSLRMPAKALSQPPDKLRDALAWEVAREMRTEASALEVRHWLLPPGHHQGMNVMAAAMPTERATAWHDLFARANLNLRRIDASPCALAYLAGRMWTPETDELWGVLDLGFKSSCLTIILDRTPTYIRSLSTSSEQWTRRLAEAFEVNLSGAEIIKRQYGIHMSNRKIRNLDDATNMQMLTNTADIPGVVFSLLRESLDDLIHEVSRCLSYAVQCFSDINISRLLLAGGGAQLSGLADYLSLQLDMPVLSLANSGSCSDTRFSNIANAGWERPLDGAEVRPDTAAAIGGALLDLETR